MSAVANHPLDDPIQDDLIQIVALYRFVPIVNPEQLQHQLLADALELGLKGTLLVAKEGINGTISAPVPEMSEFLDRMRQHPELSEFSFKVSYDTNMPFYRMKVKLKQEIVTLGIPEADPLVCVGEYVSPEHWNDLIQQPDVMLIDTRNDYEYAIGTFKGAINPVTESFRELPQFVEKTIDPDQVKAVAMFCTGGIRCEKSTSYLLQYGVKKVYHLQGGILNYLEKIPESESLWQGECFVFDNRVAVNHQLKPGQYQLCHACRYPITEEDMRSDTYQAGVSCPHCFDRISAEDKARFAERQKQIYLAKQRCRAHIGQDPKALPPIKPRKRYGNNTQQ